MKTRVSGHFGEWIQGRVGPEGPVALVTVACPSLVMQAERHTEGPFALEQDPVVLDPAVARAFLNDIGGTPGSYRLACNMVPGGGAGASTAALVALGRAAGGQEERLVAACLKVEGASDPLMLRAPDRVLWASRTGRVVADIPALPQADILGGFWGAPVATAPQDDGFADISDLAPSLRAPLSLAALAELASTSAQRCTALRGPGVDPTPHLARQLGALGHLRAHTGSARGLIFAPGQVPGHGREVLQGAGFRHVLQFRTGTLT